MLYDERAFHVHVARVCSRVGLVRQCSVTGSEMVPDKYRVFRDGSESTSQIPVQFWISFAGYVEQPWCSISSTPDLAGVVAFVDLIIWKTGDRAGFGKQRFRFSSLDDPRLLLLHVALQ